MYNQSYDIKSMPLVVGSVPQIRIEIYEMYFELFAGCLEDIHQNSPAARIPLQPYAKIPVLEYMPSNKGTLFYWPI